MRLLQRLRRSERGVAATEFALLSSLFLITALMALDIGMFMIRRSQLSNALDSAALASFSQRTAVNFAGLQSFITQAARDPNVSVTVGCNGGSGNCTNTGRTCACLTKTGTYVAATCGSACSGGSYTANSTAGYYMTLNASANYTPIILPAGAAQSYSTSQKITVRLE
jgi:Flp pilus assembly protein TadG